MKKSAILVLGVIVSGIGFVYAEDTKAPAPPAQAAPAAPAANIKVEKIAVGSAIDNKEISGEAAQFSSSNERVYCWTKVSSDQTPVTIKHVWSADGKKEAEVALEIKYPSARTWSSKSVWPGSWKVDVTDDQGKVLSSKEFTVTKEVVQPAAAPPPQAGH
jgi:hypothetical protein